ncbi:V-type proton ATPase subunit F-like [Homalodisca vitripennis]|uniref:V-type proton ATPase subunit F-like n=1 Tax=Homalodisca vitripennis TaxID=197043 RepID=UPI001EE9C40B|nr:V-type proton ATPase subunit F-like [Homalodisca vitripennis]KAG8312696.1 V-type proton ATPase subunit F [Homalodisca vitripennis]
MARRMTHQPSTSDRLIAVIGDEDTCVGFLLAGVGEIRDKKANFLIVYKDTKKSEIEDAFRDFTKRGSIEVILITLTAADKIRDVLNAYKQTLPAVLEIPSKDHPYDITKDPIVKRARDGMFNATEDIPDIT